MNNPFRRTLQTFLNGPDSSTFGYLCNLSFTKNCRDLFSCTMGGESLPRGYRCHSTKPGTIRRFRVFPVPGPRRPPWPENPLARSPQSPLPVNSTLGAVRTSLPLQTLPFARTPGEQVDGLVSDGQDSAPTCAPSRVEELQSLGGNQTRGHRTGRIPPPAIYLEMLPKRRFP